MRSPGLMVILLATEFGINNRRGMLFSNSSFRLTTRCSPVVVLEIVFTVAVIAIAVPSGSVSLYGV